MLARVNRRGEPIVTLYSADKSLRKKVREWFQAEGVDLREEDAPPRGVQAQFMLHTCGLNASVEGAAARLGGMPACLPESLDYVLRKCQAGDVSVMVGHDLVRNGLL